jgi:hypothetical protein
MTTLSNKINFQRKHPRVEVELKGNFRIPSGEVSKPLPTSIKMLGCGGLMIESSIPLAKGTRLEMNLFFEDQAIPFTGEIVWAESPMLGKTSSCKCGMRFLKISHNNLLDVHYILYTHLFKPKIKSKKTVRSKKINS